LILNTKKPDPQMLSGFHTEGKFLKTFASPEEREKY
jgi:hypothetical protein